MLAQPPSLREVALRGRSDSHTRDPSGDPASEDGSSPRNGAIMPAMVRDILELGSSLGFLDEISDGFLQQPDAVDPSWRELLRIRQPAASNGGNGNGQRPCARSPAATARPARTATNTAHERPAGNGQSANGQAGHARSIPPAIELRGVPRDASSVRPGIVTMSPIAAQTAPTVWPLVNAYRSRGHFNAQARSARPARDRADRRARPGDLGLHRARRRARDRADRRPRPAARDARRDPRRTSSGSTPSSVGLEFMHITSPARRSWLAERMETQLRVPLPADVRTRMLGAADQRRAVRAVLPHQVPRHQAVLARGQREPDPAARPGAHPRRAARRDRGGARACRTAAG